MTSADQWLLGIHHGHGDSDKCLCCDSEWWWVLWFRMMFQNWSKWLMSVHWLVLAETTNQVPWWNSVERFIAQCQIMADSYHGLYYLVSPTLGDIKWPTPIFCCWLLYCACRQPWSDENANSRKLFDSLYLNFTTLVSWLLFVSFDSCCYLWTIGFNHNSKDSTVSQLVGFNPGLVFLSYLTWLILIGIPTYLFTKSSASWEPSGGRSAQVEDAPWGHQARDAASCGVIAGRVQVTSGYQVALRFHQYLWWDCNG